MYLLTPKDVAAKLDQDKLKVNIWFWGPLSLTCLNQKKNTFGSRSLKCWAWLYEDTTKILFRMIEFWFVFPNIPICSSANFSNLAYFEPLYYNLILSRYTMERTKFDENINGFFYFLSSNFDDDWRSLKVCLINKY